MTRDEAHRLAKQWAADCDSPAFVIRGRDDENDYTVMWESMARKPSFQWAMKGSEIEATYHPPPR